MGVKVTWIFWGKTTIPKYIGNKALTSEMITRFVTEIFDSVIWSPYLRVVPALFLQHSVKWVLPLSYQYSIVILAERQIVHDICVTPRYQWQGLCKRLIWALIKLPAGLPTLPCAIFMAKPSFYGVELYQCKCLCGRPSMINHCQSMIIGHTSTQCVTLT